MHSSHDLSIVELGAIQTRLRFARCPLKKGRVGSRAVQYTEILLDEGQTPGKDRIGARGMECPKSGGRGRCTICIFVYDSHLVCRASRRSSRHVLAFDSGPEYCY